MRLLTKYQEDVRRQALNVFRIKLLGAQVIAVEAGSRTLRDAVNEALRAWVVKLSTTHYIIGSAIGPHPFPTIVRTFQSVIGNETKEQLMKLKGKLPDAVVACVGGGSNAVGMFYPFAKDPSVKMLGVEAGGDGELLGWTEECGKANWYLGLDTLRAIQPPLQEDRRASYMAFEHTYSKMSMVKFRIRIRWVLFTPLQTAFAVSTVPCRKSPDI